MRTGHRVRVVEDENLIEFRASTNEVADLKKEINWVHKVIADKTESNEVYIKLHNYNAKHIKTIYELKEQLSACLKNREDHTAHENINKDITNNLRKF